MVTIILLNFNTSTNNEPLYIVDQLSMTSSLRYQNSSSTIKTHCSFLQSVTFDRILLLVSTKDSSLWSEYDLKSMNLSYFFVIFKICRVKNEK